MAQKLTLPVLPLRGTVIFPGLTAPIAAGRPGTLRAIDTALKGDRLVFAVAQRENADEPTPEILYSMGVIARIGQVQRGLGGVQLLLQGEQRATALSYEEADGYLKAVVIPTEEMRPLDERDPAFEALHRECRERAAELGEKRGLPEEVLHQVLDSVQDPGRFADLVAGYIELPVPEKQGLLETLSVEERLRRVLVHVQRQISMLEAQEEIKSQVQEELGERQREMFLREQLKAIQKELGEDDQAKEIEELRERLRKLDLPKEARAEVERELSRLERTSRESMEAQVIRTYLEWIAELPWNKRSDDQLDLKRAAEILDEDHYGLQDVKDRVLEFLAVRQLRAQQLAEQVTRTGEHEVEQATPAEATASEAAEGEERERPLPDAREVKARAMAKGPILLFVGPPGVGKTSIAKSIARALGRQYVRVSLGGARDEADIRGHRRTYVGAMPGRIIQGMKQAGTKNPVFLLDEVDKLGVSFQGDPSAALLEVLDPAQNDTFTDHYLGVPFDLSEVLFIATANFIQNIPGPLLDRMELVEFSGYTEREKAEIAKKYLIPRQLEENGLSDKGVVFDDAAVAAVITHYTRESGVRQLERQIGAICRKIARRLAAGDERILVDSRIDEAEVRELLGRPKVHPERAAEKSEVGIATGMYYTPVGGDIMFVEASVRRRHVPLSTEDGDMAERPGPAPVSLILTGQLGDVMKESARAALTYVLNHAVEMGAPAERVEGAVEAHIHVPAGAIPKDGPSAGVAIATALMSEMTGRPVRRDVAMTGEITLRGRVLPIGGLKEKVLGAHRAGIKHIILPKENEADLEDVPEDVRRELVFHPVETLSEVFELALVGEGTTSGMEQVEEVGAGVP
ncbi:MAG TPA: endopeptidase La [Gemmatimonadaceae bacterium]|nr:endopeptidase La [Gemmatimonadaceae bacterium]